MTTTVGKLNSKRGRAIARLRVTTVCALLLVLTGGGGATVAAPPARPERAAIDTVAERLVSLEHPLCAFGVPDLIAGVDLGPTVRVDRSGYVLLHSTNDKIPLCVCERVEPENLTGPADRKDNFRPDPRLQPGSRAELADYRGSGYDRGHMAPAADYKHSQEMMNDSFYLSNIAPQVGDGFNRDIWAELESRARKAAKQEGGAYIITGPLFYDPAEESPQTADGFIEYWTIGDNRVAVPTHCYKVVITAQDGQWETVAFVLENREHPHVAGQQYNFSPYVVSIDWIEERTGLNFMPLLDDQDPDLEERLERQPSNCRCTDREELWCAFENGS